MAGTGRQRRTSASVVMQRMSFDPLKGLILHAQRKEILEKDQIEIAMKLIDFAYPKLKSIEVEAAGNQTFNISIGAAPQTQLGQDSPEGSTDGD